MKIEIFVETISNRYEPLNLFKDESIILDYKLKDTSDIGKVFSTFSQTFSIPTEGNQRLVKYFFNPEIPRSQNKYINAKIYLNDALFKVGKIRLNEQMNKSNRSSSISINFFTSASTLKDTIGETTLGSLDLNFPLLWTPDIFYSGITTNENITDIMIPLISNQRVWSYSGGTNDIKWVNSTTGLPKAITYHELRPAMRLKYLMDNIFDSLNIEVEAPLFDRYEYKELFVHLTKENIETTSETMEITYPFSAYEDFIPVSPPDGEPLPHAWNISADTDTDVFTITWDNVDTFASNQKCTFYVAMTPTITFPIDGDLSVTIDYIDLRPTSITSGITIFTQTVTLTPGNQFVSILSLDRNSFNGISLANPLMFKINVKFNTLVNLSDIVYVMRITKQGSASRYNKSSIDNNMTSFPIINLFKLLPDIKVIDLLSSLFKTFNIRVLETKEVNKIIFNTPQDFTGTTKDYTKYIDIESSSIKPQTVFQKYKFTHADSKYKSNVDIANARSNDKNSKAYGQLIYNTDIDYSNGEYNVETKFSVVPPRMIENTFTQTYYGFDATPPVDDSVYGPTTNGGRYKPNWGELLLFYYNGPNVPRDVNGNQISFAMIGNTETRQITSFSQIGNADEVLEVLYANSLGFKDEVNLWPNVFIYSEHNLYKNYYEPMIKNLANPTSFIHTFEGVLPSNEMNDFDLRDIIIIGERKYTIEDASLDLTTGKIKLNLVNISVQKQYEFPPSRQMWTLDTYIDPNITFTRNYGTDTAMTVQTSTDGGASWGNSTGGTTSPRNIGSLSSGTLIRLVSISDDTRSNIITV